MNNSQPVQRVARLIERGHRTAPPALGNLFKAVVVNVGLAHAPGSRLPGGPRQAVADKKQRLKFLLRPWLNNRELVQLS